MTKDPIQKPGEHVFLLKMVSCPLTKMIFKDPICAIDNILYEKEAIELFLRTGAIKPPKKLQEPVNESEGNSNEEEEEAEEEEEEETKEANEESNSELMYTLPSGMTIICLDSEINSKILIEPAPFMKETAKVFLNTYPEYESKVFSLKYYKESPKIDYSQLMSIDPKYFLTLCVNISKPKTKGNPHHYYGGCRSYPETSKIIESIHSHNNFSIESLIIDSKAFSIWFDPISMFLMHSTYEQLVYIIDELTYDETETDPNLLAKFLMMFLKAISRRVKMGYSFVNGVPRHEGKTYGPCEDIICYLMEVHPIFKSENVLGNADLNVFLATDCSHIIEDSMFALGFKYNAKGTMRLFGSDQPICPDYLEDRMNHLTIGDNKVDIVEAVTANKNMNRRHKTEIIQWLK